MPICIVPSCGRIFSTEVGLVVHQRKSLDCAAWFLRQPVQQLDPDDLDLWPQIQEEPFGDDHDTFFAYDDLSNWEDEHMMEIDSDHSMDDALSLRSSSISATESGDPHACYYKYQFCNAGKKFGHGSTPYEQTMAAEVDPQNVTYPFAGLDEWELAKWLSTTECLEWLEANPDFSGDKDYVPYEEYLNKDHTDRCYSEMASGEFWNDTQAKFPEDITINPYLLTTDSTHLTNFSGDKKVKPLLIASGHMRKKIRAKPSVTTGQSHRTPGTNLYATTPYTHQLSVYRISLPDSVHQDLLHSTSLRHISVTGLPPDSISVYVRLHPTHQSPDPTQNPVTTLIEPHSHFSQMTCLDLDSAPTPFPIMGYALSRFGLCSVPSHS
ncbi:hypothetical protein BU17DRAFT_92237 [Hysterangium stoloniferum]|nr:hypothetical protein BU17DRAFT_92237 [Hysterangium stoloniferum]